MVCRLCELDLVCNAAKSGHKLRTAADPACNTLTIPNVGIIRSSCKAKLIASLLYPPPERNGAYHNTGSPISQSGSPNVFEIDRKQDASYSATTKKSSRLVVATTILVVSYSEWVGFLASHDACCAPAGWKTLARGSRYYFCSKTHAHAHCKSAI